MLDVAVVFVMHVLNMTRLTHYVLHPHRKSYTTTVHVVVLEKKWYYEKPIKIDRYWFEE